MDDLTLITRVRSLVETMYRAYLRGDRAGIDQFLDPSLTMFDSSSALLVSGMDELNEVRAARKTGGGNVPASERIETALTADFFTARRIGDVVSATWWLRVDAADGAGHAVVPEIVRNSAVLVDDHGSLRIVHIHEDVLQRLGGPVVDGLPTLSPSE